MQANPNNSIDCVSKFIIIIGKKKITSLNF